MRHTHLHIDTMNARAALHAIGMISLLAASAASRAQEIRRDTGSPLAGESFPVFIKRVNALPTLERRNAELQAFVARAGRFGSGLVADSTVSFLYLGTAQRVGVPADFNGWRPAADTMRRIEGTDFFYLSKTIDIAARFEYKFAVDSTWILDPCNPRQAIGGYGPNSEIWMPAYRPPPEILPREGTPRGTIDTLEFSSRILGRTHPVFVYRPAGYARSLNQYPVIFVTDGGEYLSLALMNTIMDNLIADGAIPPIIGVFIDPRTDPSDSRTSTRMADYTFSDDFVRALTDELRPQLLARYRLLREPEQTAIVGASLGALIATYAAFTRPDIFGLCAAQSPAYDWQDDRMIALVASSPRKPFRIHIDTGTLRDAKEHAYIMRDTMQGKGYPVHYEEHPEGHNWVNWRARIGTFLRYFWGAQ
jgi:enterochelin esterase-like enzyme